MLWQSLSCATCETNEPRVSLIDMDVCTYRSLCYLMAAIDLCENSTVHTAPIPTAPSRPDSIADRVCAGKSVSKKENCTAAKLWELIERSGAGHRVRATEPQRRFSLMAFSHRKVLKVKMEEHDSLDLTEKNTRWNIYSYSVQLSNTCRLSEIRKWKYEDINLSLPMFSFLKYTSVLQFHIGKISKNKKIKYHLNKKLFSYIN